MTSIKQKKKAKKMAIIGVLSLIVVAALCFVFGFAIAEGWQAVGAWFKSKWAVLTIIAITIVVIALVFYYFRVKDKEDFR